ncbi:DUF5677 domain-containing protein [Streptococcus henryi]|uniref:DUF5677 domain-containing protein n=1 Tax=Streptococcus henryi TaxID=439219 RepID=UPI000378B5D0|nr:DUF5677 domain-containing protein [Streptococcus henryi]
MKKKIVDKDYCPCDSGKVYEDCCKLKDIEWTISDGKITRTQRLVPEIEEILLEIKENFKQLYGREMNKEDYYFGFAPNFRNDSMLHIMESMRAANIPEEIIYAHFKTDGLLPIEELNLDKIPDGYLAEFEEYTEEYENAMNSDIVDEISSIKYVAMMNSIMEVLVLDTGESLKVGLTDFIHRHSEGKQITNFEMKTELDYCMFSALKTIKTLESVSILKSEFVSESIYALGRSIFENYLYLCAINQEENFFKEKMYPKIDSKKFAFSKNSNGKYNYNKVVNRQTGETHNVKVLLSDLKNKLNDTRYKELYDVFYQTACQFVHVDILTAESYFECHDPYDELNPSLVANVIINTLSLLVLKEISNNRCVQNQFKIDCEYLTSNISNKISECLVLIRADKERPNAIIDVLHNRLK